MEKTLKTSPEGRKCKFLNCKHLLSIYNHEPYCHIHRDQISRERTVKTPYHHMA
ncbi:MAG: hypothetical protein ACYTEK_25220 [Planctomycetota bacterium]|jgi:hypothetical protein